MAGEGSRGKGADEPNIVGITKDVKGQAPSRRRAGNVRVRNARAYSSMVTASTEVGGRPASAAQGIRGGRKVGGTHEAGGGLTE